MTFVRATVALATVAATFPTLILLLALRSAAVVAVFPPVSRFSRFFGGLLLFLEILAFIPRLHFWCCLFCSVCLFSSSFSPLVASLVWFSCWPPSLLVRVWLWGPAWYSFIFVPHVSPSSHMLRSKEGYQICVSSLRFGSGLYDGAGFLGGSHMGCVGRDLAVVPCWWSLYMCVGFFFCGGRAVYPLLLLGVGLALTEPLLVCLLSISWGTCGFPLRVVKLSALLGFHT